jgi:tetratricopeptide (TPR) repeat protein
MTMSKMKFAAAVLSASALVWPTLAFVGGTGAERPADIAELLDPVALARHLCGMHSQHHSEAFAPGMQLAVAAAAAAQQPAVKPPPLWDNLGNLTWKVTTKSETAQRYFDQGLRLAYAFNHAEARRAFRAAQAADPGCAMCYWGEALVLGPNINYPMLPDAVEPAFAASAKAQALSNAASPKEQALIRALAKRYSPDAAADRSALDAAYANAMTDMVAAFGDDDNVQVLFAEALMDLSPWDYWQADAKTPKGRTAEVIGALEAVLKRNPNHPGAIHYYIHTVEASTTPERALPYADRLGALMPGAGHLVHMPAHVYYRVGRYKDALAVNVAAIKADETYFRELESEGVQPSGIYRYGYYPHNVHFVLVAAQLSGDGVQTIAAAEKLEQVMSDTMARKVGWIQPIKAAPYFAHAQFSTPDTILALSEPPREFPFVQASWHYARAMAYVARGDLDQVRLEEKALADLASHGDFATLTAWGVPAADIITIERWVVDGRIARAEGRQGDAIAAFQKAVAAQDKLPYMEPQFWYYPVRQSLAAAELAAGRTDDAIQTFQESLVSTPNNAYALYGLAEALKRKGDTAAANVIESRFRAAWSGPGRPELKSL